MQTKLTLSVNPELVVSAKKYAAQNSTSVSRLVELFLRQLTTHSKTKSVASQYPISDSLFGSVPTSSKTSDRDLVTEYLEEKYA